MTQENVPEMLLSLASQAEGTTESYNLEWSQYNLYWAWVSLAVGLGHGYRDRLGSLILPRRLLCLNLLLLAAHILCLRLLQFTLLVIH